MKFECWLIHYKPVNSPDKKWGICFVACTNYNNLTCWLEVASKMEDVRPTQDQESANQHRTSGCSCIRICHPYFYISISLSLISISYFNFLEESCIQEGSVVKQKSDSRLLSSSGTPASTFDTTGTTGAHHLTQLSSLQVIGSSLKQYLPDMAGNG